MGVLWSKPQVPDAQVLAPALQKRAIETCNHGTTSVRKEVEQDACKKSNGSSAHAPKKRTREPAFAANAEAKRFIVRCPGLFWLSKRDIARILSQADGLPPYAGLHKIPRWDYFFLNFLAADVSAGRAALENITYRGTAFSVGEAEHPSAKRRRANAAIASLAEARSSVQPAQCPSAASATAPWGDVPYHVQMQRKRKLWRTALVTVANRMRSDPLVGSTTPWLREIRPGAPVCKLERLEFCAEGDAGRSGRDYYRNKTEFTIGMSIDACGVPGHAHAALPTIGYSLGQIREGEFRVGPVTEDCVTTAAAARQVARILTDVVRKSGQPPYDRLLHTGYWRQVTCRTSERTQQVLVSVMVSTGGAAATRGNNDVPLSDEQCRQAVAEALCSMLGSENRFGLFWQSTDELSPTMAGVEAEHVCGLSALNEELLGLKFAVHPNSFFQVNTVMAERLYTVVREFADAGRDTTVLDVCCGTGTIGLILAGAAHNVVGVDVCEPAINCARFNAQMNGITNATFIAGPAERMIQQAIQMLAPDRDCVAVLDPPRAGVANSVISAVRGARSIRRVVYVCCEPANLWRNILSLCRPTSNAFRGDPFRPMRAAGVDLFSHTPRGEIVLQLER